MGARFLTFSLHVGPLKVKRIAGAQVNSKGEPRIERTPVAVTGLTYEETP